MSEKAAQSPTNEEILLEYNQHPTVDLRNLIHERYTYVAKAIARKYAGRGIDYDDLEQVASIALIKAIERYDVNRGVKFQSFAAPTIIGEIKNYFRAFSNNVKVPRRAIESISKIKVAVNELTIQLQRSPTVKEIAEHTSMPEERVLEMLDVANNYKATSLDAVLISDGEGTLKDIVGDRDAGYEQVENRDFLKKAMAQLSEQDRFIIYQRYYHTRSQREVAQMLGVSQMYISRAENRIIKTMRKMH